MSDLKSIFFHFLRLGLFGEDDECPVPKLTDTECSQLFAWSREQAVSGVWVDGVAQTPYRPPEAMWAQWIFHVMHIERMNRLLQETEQRWVKALEGNGMQAEVFKGSSVARWYRKPLYRSYGDIDLVVTQGWKNVEPYLQAKGYAYRHEEDSLAVQDGNIPIELHPWRESLYNPVVNARLRQLLSVDRAGNELYLACLMLHLRRHVLTYGIGLKQVCDVAVMLRQAPLDRDELAGILRKLRMVRFCRVLFAFLAKHLAVESGIFPVAPARDGKALLLEEVIWREGYLLKMEREAVSARRWKVRRIAGNAWFWLKRSVRLMTLMPDEAAWFIVYKILKRLGFNRIWIG